MRGSTGGPYRCCTGQQRVDIRKRSSIRSVRESELPIVPFGSRRQHNFGRGKGQCFHRDSEGGKDRRLRNAGNSGESSGTSEETIPEGQAGNCESLWKKMIGKPCAGKLHARFDEGEPEIENFATTPALYSTPFRTGLPLHICGYIDPIIEDILNLGIAALSLASPSSLKRMIGISRKKIFQAGKTATSFFVLGTRKKYSRWFKRGCSPMGAFIIPLRCEFPHNAPLRGRIFHRIRGRIEKILVRKILAENLLTI